MSHKSISIHISELHRCMIEKETRIYTSSNINLLQLGKLYHMYGEEAKQVEVTKKQKNICKKGNRH